MSTLQNTDLFAVHRGTETYKVNYGDIVAGVSLPSVLEYKGSANPTQPVPSPTGGLKVGMVYALSPSGTIHASWTGVAGLAASDGQLAVWEGAKWELIGENGLSQPDASETVKGIAEIATTAEVKAGTDDQRIVTPLKLKGFQQQFTIQSATPPTLVTHPNIVNGTIWVDISQSPPVINLWDPTANSGAGGWGTTAGGASVTTSDTAPTTPKDGDLWYDSVGGRTYVYYNDGDTSQWVDIAPQGGGGGGVSGVISVDGVTFPAAQVASADPNTLDDYEEGTFTPSLTFGGASVGMTYAPNRQSGRYVKIGRMVYFYIHITILNKGTSTGNARVTGLPFTPPSVDAYTPMSVWFAEMSSLTGTLMPRVDDRTPTIDVWQQTNSNFAATTDANYKNNASLQLSGQYEA